MDQDKINEAVTECVRYTMAAEKPLESLQQWFDLREAEGWPRAELTLVRQAALRMLTAIYDAQSEE